jgi:hypothetical protein
MVGVGDPVRSGPRLCDDRVLVEREGAVARPGERQHVRDRIGSPRVRNCMAAAVVDAKRYIFLLTDRGEQLGAGARRTSNLEVGTSRPGHGTRAEEGAAEIGATAAGAADDALRGRLERRVADRDDAGIVQDPERSLAPVNVDLVARRLLEGPPAIRANLRFDAERPQEPESAARD